MSTSFVVIRLGVSNRAEKDLVHVSTGLLGERGEKGWCDLVCVCWCVWYPVSYSVYEGTLVTN